MIHIYNKKNPVILLTLLFLFAGWNVNGKTVIRKQQVEYTTNPIGIDVEKPRFSWQIDSDKRGVLQSSYQIQIAKSPEELSTGIYLYDSGEKKSSESVGIPYEGPVLQPSTRYYWKTTIQDNQGNRIESDEPAYFETGLLGTGWNNATWIGSSHGQLSKYRTHYVIDYDVEIAPGSDKATFIFGMRDIENYVTVELDLLKNNESLLRITHTTEGKEIKDMEENISHLITKANRNEKHHITLEVSTAQYAMQYFVQVLVDGNKVKENLTISPYPNGELIYQCRLYSIGFNQPKKQQATFSSITISEKAWKTVLYKAPQDYLVMGDGKKQVWSPGEEFSAPMLRKELKIAKEVKNARLYATARGIYEFYINGKRVGTDFFNPGWTDYRYRLLYNTFDVTDLLKKGDNVLGAILGTGWWSEHNGFMTGWQDQYGSRESLLGKLYVEYTDGTSAIFVTDSSWKCYDKGPILSNSFQNGEEYDARKEVPDWNMPLFDDSSWETVTLYPELSVNVKLQAYIGNPVQNRIQLKAVAMVEPKPGVFVYDMGQNLVGVPRIKIKGKSGQELTFRYGEMNYPETIPTDPISPYTIEMYKEKKGQVYTDNYRGALSADRYIIKGDPKGEIFEPRFTSHGYRYVEIHGLEKALPLEDVEGLVLESVGELTSGYTTSNKEINRLYENIVWGQRGNFLTIPTDCPQRDERMGWTGDAQIFVRSATYNMNVNQFYTRWLYTLRDNQGENGNYPNFAPVIDTPPYGGRKGNGSIGWAEAGIIVPWQIFQQYNDLRILEENYESMVRYMNHLERRAVNYIQPYDPQPFGDLGDWLAIDYTNTLLTNTAYFAYDAWLMTQIATALNKKKDSTHYEELYLKIKESFNKEFVDAEGYTHAPASESLFGSALPRPAGKIDTQTSYIVPLYFGLFNEKNKQLAIEHLKEAIARSHNTLTTGFIGTPYLNLVLSENGYDELAYTLFEQTEYPSWLYPVLQGATTMWERWNSYTIINGFGPVGMNSFNHYAYGAIQEWMFAYSIGIQRDEKQPGYKHILLQPRIGGSFTYIKGHYDTVYGRVESSWNKSDKEYTYQATIPANTTATLYLPVTDPSKVIENGIKIEKAEGVKLVGYEAGKAIYELTSGTYRIKVTE